MRKTGISLLRSLGIGLAGLVGAILVVVSAIWVLYVRPQQRLDDSHWADHSRAVEREREQAEKMKGEFARLSGSGAAPVIRGGLIQSSMMRWVPGLLLREDLWETAKYELAEVGGFAPGVDASLTPKLRQDLLHRRDFGSGNSGVLADRLLYLADPPAEALAVLKRNAIRLPKGCAYRAHELRDVDGDGRPELLLWQDCREKPGLDREYPTDILAAYRLGSRPAVLLFESDPVSYGKQNHIGRHRRSPAPQILLREEASFSVYEYGGGRLKRLLRYDRTGLGGRNWMSFAAVWRDFDGDGVDELVVKQFFPGSSAALEENDEGWWDGASLWNPISVFEFGAEGAMRLNAVHTKAVSREVLAKELAGPQTGASALNAAICYRALGRNDEAVALLKRKRPSLLK